MKVPSLKKVFSFEQTQSGTPQPRPLYWMAKVMIVVLLSMLCVFSVDFFTHLTPTLNMTMKILGVVSLWFSLFLEILYAHYGIIGISPVYSLQLLLSSIAFLVILLSLAQLPGPEHLGSLGEIVPGLSEALDLRIIVLLVAFGLYLLVEAEIFTIVLKKK